MKASWNIDNFSTLSICCLGDMCYLYYFCSQSCAKLTKPLYCKNIKYFVCSIIQKMIMPRERIKKTKYIKNIGYFQLTFDNDILYIQYLNEI